MSIKIPAREQGRNMESLAADYLQSQGLKLHTQNFQSRRGEIDLVFLDQETLVFVEVRFRKHTQYGGPLSSIDFHKQRKIILSAQYYLKCHPKDSKRPCRFDVIGITLTENVPKIEWIRNAFEAN